MGAAQPQHSRQRVGGRLSELGSRLAWFMFCATKGSGQIAQVVPVVPLESYSQSYVLSVKYSGKKPAALKNA